MKKTSFVIVTYNSKSLIKDCIDSIFKYNDVHLDLIEILVIDNSNYIENRELFDYLETLYGNKIIKIKNKGNLGYGHGNNVGIGIATGEIICIMNPDVRLVEPLLRVVNTQYISDTKLCLLGFSQLGGSNLSHYIKPEYYIPILNPLLIKLTNRLNIFNSKFSYLSGAFFFIHKAKFQSIGLFDESLFMFFEEADICNRILAKNYSVKYMKEYKYLHFMNERNDFSRFAFEVGLDSLKHYTYKYKFSESRLLSNKIITLKFKLLLSNLNGNKNGSQNQRVELQMLSERLKSLK
jgi:GT2 family glycosyltransferase